MPVVVVIQGQFLLAMCGVFRIIHVENDHLRRLGIAAGDLENTLGQQIIKRVINIRRVPLILDRGAQAGYQANLLINTAQQQGTKIGGQRTRSKSALTVKPLRGGKRNWYGVESDMGRPCLASSEALLA
jgi:hypothetical protein